MSVKRILWIVNHRTLMPAEVPILRSLDFEVLIPKLIPRAAHYRSGAVDYSYDKGLSIDRLALDVLNNHAFYERRWSPTVEEIIDEHFDVIVTSVSVYNTPLAEAISKFRGTIAARVFGRDKPFTYSDYLAEPGWAGIMENIVAADERFVFCQAFDNLVTAEDPRLKVRAHTVIASLPDWMWAHRGRWTGEHSHALFLCPDIMTTHYYGDIYREFKAELGSIPHRIFGKQSVMVNDPTVLPSLSDTALFDQYAGARLFLYPSREPRHLHYSPVEAMIVGAPVLFHAGGLLHHLGGDRQAGLCGDFKEMRGKADRLIQGDHALADEIRHDQEHIVQTFASDLARAQWGDLLARVPSHRSRTSAQAV